MREILFRAKSLHFDKWIEGYYAKGDKDCIVSFGDAGIKWQAVKPETVGQFTGVTAKNGKIFEGDCWLDTDGGDYLAYVVEFRDGQFGFVCYGTRGMLMPYGYDDEAGGWGEIDFTPFTDYYIDEVEIIGNIHDNPELLKGGADNG